MPIHLTRCVCRIAAVAGIAALLAACGNGPGGQPAATAVSPTDRLGPTEVPWTPEVVRYPPVAMGQRSVQRGVGVTVLRVTALDKAGDFSPGTDRVYLSAEVELENVDLDALQYAFYHFSVEDDAGKAYGAVRITPTSAPAPAMAVGTLKRGEKARGNVLFEAPKGLTSGMLVYLYASPGLPPGQHFLRSAWRM